MKPKLRPILGAGAGLLRQEQQNFVLTASQDSFDTWTAKNLSKRYDLNSWRQNEEETKEEEAPVFNPTVLPPNMNTVQNFPTVPDYPPPNVNRFNNFSQENYANYLQQGDGTYIQNQYQDRQTNNSSFTQQGDGAFPTTTFQVNIPSMERQNSLPERTTTEAQKSNNRRPMENWRKDKPDIAPPKDGVKQRNWTRKTSEDNSNEPETKDEDTDPDDPVRSSRASSREIRPGNYFFNIVIFF